MREYRLGLFIRVFAYALAAGALVGAYFALVAALDASSPGRELLFHLVVLACIGVAIFSTGKSTTYYLELKRWSDLKDDEEVSVTRSMYDNTEAGDELMVNQYPGLLGMEWIVIE